jgi:outer membrane protein TolC
MKVQLISILFIVSAFFQPHVADAQTTITVEERGIYDSISIPPLSMMIDSAISHNAMLQYFEHGITAKKISLRADSKSWTKNFGIQADVRYGTFDNFSTNTAEGQNPSLIATKTNQTNYGIGAYLKLPLSDFINHKSLIQLAKAEVNQAESMAEVQRDEIRQIVIKQYNDLILKLSLLQIKAKNLETSRVNLVMAEKEFQNGIIPLGTYAGISQTAGNSEINFEEAKVEFKTAYMILEEIVGFKFNIKIQ